MTAADLLIHLAGLGFHVKLRSNNILVAPREMLPDDLRQAIRENKSELLPLLSRVPPAQPSPEGCRQGRENQQAKVKSFVCPVCELPRPGQASCPRCKLEREEIERKRLLALGVNFAPGNLRCNDPRLKLPPWAHPDWSRRQTGEW